MIDCLELLCIVIMYSVNVFIIELIRDGQTEVAHAEGQTDCQSHFPESINLGGE